MFQCNYKYELEDSLVSAKYIYKSGRRTRDKVIAVLLPILLVCMVVMLIVDICMHRQIVWDIVLIIALSVLELMYLLMPLILKNSQKKSFKLQNLADMDSLNVTIDDKTCTATLIKNGQEMAKNSYNLKSLTSYIEDEKRLILVFNGVEYVCLRKQYLSGDIEKLKIILKKSMYKTNKK